MKISMVQEWLYPYSIADSFDSLAGIHKLNYGSIDLQLGDTLSRGRLTVICNWGDFPWFLE
jgi:hypothetical protein